MQDLPKALYKYVDPPGIVILETLEIGFTPRSAFNDPFDLLPAVTEMTNDEVLRAVLRTAKNDRWKKQLAGEMVPPEDIYLKNYKSEGILLAKAMIENQDFIQQEALSGWA